MYAAPMPHRADRLHSESTISGGAIAGDRQQVGTRTPRTHGASRDGTPTLYIHIYIYICMPYYIIV